MVVEVDNGFTAVLVRPFSSFDELPPTAMNNRDDGTWGALVTLPTAEDWLISFEGIRETGETVRSDSAFLSELGVDPIVIGDPPSTPVPGRAWSHATWWLVIAVVGTLAALAALAWWTFAPEPDADAVDDADDDEDLTNGRE